MGATPLLSLLEMPGYVGLLLVAYWLLVVVFIVFQDRDPTMTLLWILVLTVLPLLGLVIYFFVGRDWKHTVPRQAGTKSAKATMMAAMAPVYEPYAGVRAAFRERNECTIAERISNTITAENDAQPMPVRDIAIYPTGAEFFDHLKADLRAARRFIHLEYYIWERDELTAEILAILIERLKDGVQVRLMYDWVGSFAYRKDELQQLARAGAEVHADVTQLGSLNYRNHRKIAVVDGEIGYTGGHNIGQEYIDGGDAYPCWRDTSARVTGPGVASLQKWFAYRWLMALGDAGLFDRSFFPAVDPTLTTGEPLMIQVVAQGVDDPMESSRRTHMTAISGACRTLRIASPYYVPDQGIYDAMINAALSGVDVRFMMTGWPDHRAAFWAAQSYWGPLIRAGVHVHLYEAGFFHAKTICVDSEVCAIGTMNLDQRSLRLQRELMLWVFDAKTTRSYESVFDRDLEDSREVTLDDIESMGSLVRLRSSASRLGANLL
jgi:cardiolipin synthase